MNELAAIAAVDSLPTWLRLGVGHAAPLAAALAWTAAAARRATRAQVLQAAALVAVFAVMTAATARVVSHADGSLVVALWPGPLVIAALVASFTCRPAPSAAAVAALAFWPLYIADVGRALLAFSGPLEVLEAVGGAGPLDALVVGPALAAPAATLGSQLRRRLSRCPA